MNSGRGSNIKYYPYAFTIDGIDVLSTILYGDSIKDNYIKIFNYFNKTNDIVDNSLEIVRYENGEVSIDISVSPSEETVWLTQSDMATIFETTKQNISSHIQSIFESYKMLENSVVKKYLTTETVKNVITRASDGKEYNTTYYNLDVIIPVGYRVNSKRYLNKTRWLIPSRFIV